VNSYEVATPALTTNARTLDDLAKALGDALTAATVTIAADAYGQPGARFAGALGSVGREGQNTIRAGIAALEAAAKGLRASAHDYDGMEDAGSDAFTDIEMYEGPSIGTTLDGLTS